MQTDHLISARRPELVRIKKKKTNLLSIGFCRSSGPQRKKNKIKQKHTWIWALRAVEHADDGNTNCCWSHRNSP